MNIGGGHFPHFEANPFREFEGGNNNPLPLPSLGFEGDLGGGFNLLSERNVRGLDPNIAALVNVLTEVNLEINHIERESNYVKPTEFRRTEAEDPNE